MLLEIALAIAVGLGIALTTLSYSLFYKIFFATNNYDNPLVIMTIAFFSLWIGATLLSSFLFVTF